MESRLRSLDFFKPEGAEFSLHSLLWPLQAEEQIEKRARFVAWLLCITV